jgi:hypothetical protein
MLESEWIPERWCPVAEAGWRPGHFWTPCALLRTDVVLEARRDGVGFATKVVYNDFSPSRHVSALLAGRFDCDLTPDVRWLELVPRRLQPPIRRTRLPWLRWARAEYEGQRPNFVYYDTGARLHRWCIDHGLRFAGARHASDQQLVHVDGASIALREGGVDSPVLQGMELDLQRRLREHYGIEWSSFGVPAWSAFEQERG